VKRVEAYTDSWTFPEMTSDGGDDGVALMVHEQWTPGDRKVMCKRLACVCLDAHYLRGAQVYADGQHSGPIGARRPPCS